MNQPKIHVTPPTPSGSSESFEIASPNEHEWDLKPYHFNCTLLPTTNDTHKEFNEIATVCMPEYHRLIDHTLGVAWKTICNGRRDIGKLSPDQIVWALKVVEAHQNEHNHLSDDMRLLIQYWQEIIVSMYASGGTVPISDGSTAEPSQAPLEDNSFMLTNMRPKTTPAASPSFVSTNNLSPLMASTPLPRNDDQPSSLTRTQQVLIQNLESLQQMLVRWKKEQLRRIDGDMQQLEAIERLLLSMAAEG